MAYQPKSYRKFLAGSVSAAVVATTFGAVAPVTADAAAAFPDVSDDYWASSSIQNLAEQGIIGGYKDGTYRPGQEINRGQVAAMLVEAFDLPVNENVEPPFEDLSEESYFTPAAAAVKEAGLIKGREDNTQFAAGMDLSREQMASILVRAFGFDEKAGVDADVKDLEEAHESHRNNIEILAQYDITKTASGNFRPKETVTRAQFAAFLDRAMKVDQAKETGVVNATAVNNTTVEVSFNGEMEDVNAEDFTFEPELAVLDAEIIKPSDSEASQDAAGSVVRLTTEEQDAEISYELQYQGKATGQSIKGAGMYDITVADITPVSTGSFDIELDNALNEDWDEEDVEEKLDVAVVNGDDQTDVDITGVTISDDRKTITVEHADNDLEGTTGTLVVNGFEYDFDYDTIDVESVEATTTSIRSAADQKLAFTVNGFRNLSVEALEEAGYDVAFKYSKTGEVYGDNGVVDASDLAGESFRYAVEITDEDGNTVKSEEQTVDVHGETNIAEVTDVAFFDGDDEWKRDYVTSANEGLKIKATAAENAFGEELDADDLNNATLESVTSDDIQVAYYDMDNGLQVVGEGETTLTAEFEGVEDTVTIDVKVVADQEVSGIAEDDTTKRYTTNATTGTFTVVDQYGEPFGEGEEISYTITDADGAETTDVATVQADGTFNVTFPENASGEYTIDFAYDGANLGSTNLEFLELEGFDELDLEADPETVDLADAATEGSVANDDADLAFAVTATGTFEGITLSEDELEDVLGNLDGELQVRTSNKAVASLANDGETETMSLTAAEAADGFEAYGRTEGTATLYLEQIEGDFVTTLGQVEVEVENTLPQISNLTLAEGTDSLTLTSEGKIKDLEELSSSDADLEDYMVEETTYSANDKKAIVKMKDLFGGKTFVVDAVQEEASAE
ncbi:S-layer homology domain-containing protein [Bacillus piscicola]|uniref:S-layer homology domain-containing protein n=1 Tax=Bacillus piscicola TaxID=1632684 RepID=UPI001F08E520|nr:S-layer homology domain-containing protein [Bacillus piscicola]